MSAAGRTRVPWRTAERRLEHLLHDRNRYLLRQLTLLGPDGYGWDRQWRRQEDECEALRGQWADSTLDERKVLARKMQQIWWAFVGFVFLGETNTPIARRNTLTRLIGYPALFHMWNIQQGA